MHGRVVAVAVAPGAHVEKGDPLFSLEAMKMEHGVVAPLAGIVQAVRIVAGQQVEEGVLAVIIEPRPCGLNGIDVRRRVVRLRRRGLSQARWRSIS